MGTSATPETSVVTTSRRERSGATISPDGDDCVLKVMRSSVQSCRQFMHSTHSLVRIAAAGSQPPSQLASHSLHWRQSWSSCRSARAKSAPATRKERRAGRGNGNKTAAAEIEQYCRKKNDPDHPGAFVIPLVRKSFWGLASASGSSTRFTDRWTSGMGSSKPVWRDAPSI